MKILFEYMCYIVYKKNQKCCKLVSIEYVMLFTGKVLLFVFVYENQLLPMFLSINFEIFYLPQRFQAMQYLSVVSKCTKGGGPIIYIFFYLEGKLLLFYFYKT